MTKILPFILLITLAAAQSVHLTEFIADWCNYDVECINLNPVDPDLTIDASSFMFGQEFNQNWIFEEDQIDEYMAGHQNFCPVGMYPDTEDYTLCRQLIRGEQEGFTCISRAHTPCLVGSTSQQSTRCCPYLCCDPSSSAFIPEVADTTMGVQHTRFSYKCCDRLLTTPKKPRSWNYWNYKV